MKLVFIRKLLDMITYIINSPQDVHDIITERINFRRFIELPASYFTAYCNYPRILIIYFVIFQDLDSANRMYRNVFLSTVHYFLYTLYLLIHLLLFKTICYIFYNSDSFIKFILLYIDVTV